MKSFHAFLSTGTPNPRPGAVKSADWNDAQSVGMVGTAYAASGIVPTTVDYIRATGGGGGIALQLTSGSRVVTGASGSVTVGQVYFAKKVDAGAGPITFSDLGGALFEDGASTYLLTQKGQWAIFVWNGTAWEVFGGMFS